MHGYSVMWPAPGCHVTSGMRPAPGCHVICLHLCPIRRASGCHVKPTAQWTVSPHTAAGNHGMHAALHYQTEQRLLSGPREKQLTSSQVHSGTAPRQRCYQWRWLFQELCLSNAMLWGLTSQHHTSELLISGFYLGLFSELVQWASLVSMCNT